MLYFWVINSARLLGIKYYQRALGLRVAPQGRTYKVAKGSSGSRVCTKAVQADAGCTTDLWGLALLATLLKRSRLIPSLTAGWRVWFCTHKGKPHLVRDKTWSFVCPIVISAQVLLNAYHVPVFWYGRKTQEKERFLPLSSLPHPLILPTVKTVLYITV